MLNTFRKLKLDETKRIVINNEYRNMEITISKCI